MNRILKSAISVTFALGILVIGVPISAEDGSAFPERGKAPEGKELEIMIQRANLGLDRAPEIPEELWPEHGPATGLAYRSQAE